MIISARRANYRNYVSTYAMHRTIRVHDWPTKSPAVRRAETPAAFESWALRHLGEAQHPWARSPGTRHSSGRARDL